MGGSGEIDCLRGISAEADGGLEQNGKFGIPADYRFADLSCRLVDLGLQPGEGNISIYMVDMLRNLRIEPETDTYLSRRLWTNANDVDFCAITLFDTVLRVNILQIKRGNGEEEMNG